MGLTPTQLQEKITKGQLVEVVGQISGELAARAGAWDGNAPDWFPEPPEWLELTEKALAQVLADKPEPYAWEKEDWDDQYPEVRPTVVNPEEVDHDCGCG